MAPAAAGVTLDCDGRPVTITHPDRVVFPTTGTTKLDLAQYYVRVGGSVVGVMRDRPMLLKRYPGGASSEPFYQNRAPESRPDWITTAAVEFGAGGSGGGSASAAAAGGGSDRLAGDLAVVRRPGSPGTTYAMWRWSRGMRSRMRV